eukprot:CAMPEP_0116011964 /NCGR_PEP_ID=MMETSP0321-20121206/4859_1 /TAXON_ID=163516 /ORGANISM="Leptocylindrus danicus var. danicus, Strain B650" /LENGTH=299 /DNA_ID=CAMNT_0003481253 /DNA_START=501 /DNA_END=1400 /DNA_ORIENTATION=-
MTQTLWVCLTCGETGCGRYTYGHARKHYQQSNHPFALELVTQRIWDYAADKFVQRGDLLDCRFIRERTAFVDALSPGSTLSPGSASGDDHMMAFCGTLDGEINDLKGVMMLRKPNDLDGPTSPKKASMISEEYEILLQSALEEQAMHFEAEISKLCAELAVKMLDEKTVTAKEAAEAETIQNTIAALRNEEESLSKKLLEVQAQNSTYLSSAQQLLREQSTLKDQLQKLTKEATQERLESEARAEELEQQISDLTTFLTMQQQISDDAELREAEIVSTKSTPQKKNKMRNGKKKHRGRK